MGTFQELKGDVNRPLQVLLYGQPGTMKTIQAHSFPRPRTLDLDRGLLSVLSAVKAGVIPEPEGWVFETILETKFGKRGFVKQATAFDEACITLDKWLTPEEVDEWDTLIVDSATALSDYVINKALEEMGKLGSKSHEKSKSSNVRIMQMQDWGGSVSMFQQFVDWIRGLDKNIVFVCHEYEQTDSEGNVVAKLPLLIGQLRQKILKDFDEVWYNKTKGTRDTQRVVTQTKSDAKVVAKSRLGVFEAEEELLTWQRIQEKISAKS